MYAPRSTTMQGKAAMTHMSSLSRRPLRAALVLSLAIAGASAFAAPPLRPYYAGGHIGQNDVETWPARVDFGGGVTSPAQLRLDKDLHFGIFAGRQTDNSRLELEYQRGNADITAATLGAVTQARGGRARYQALTANAYRTFDIAQRITAFAGLGIGWGSVELPLLAPIGTCNCFREASDGGFVWQLRLGAEYQVRPGHNVFGQFTLLNLPDVGSGGTPSVSYDNKRVRTLSVGYRADINF